MDTREAHSGNAEGPFVGRDRELAVLRAGVERRGQVFDRFFLVDGEPGIGRTRLCEEIAAVARGGGARLLTGRCRQGAPDYSPWRDALAAHVSTADATQLARDLGAGAALVGQLVPEIGARVGRAASAAAASVFVTEAARFALFDSVAQFLEATARVHPLVLVFDDLHAADVASLLLLQFVVRNSRDAAITLVATYRDHDRRARPEVAGLFDQIAPAARSLTLEGLGEGDVARLVAAATGRAARPETVRLLHRRTAGNPGYLHALLRSLHTAGVGLADEERIAAVLPDSVRDSVRGRVAALAPACGEALRVASLIGLEFDLRAVAHACATEVETMRTLLEEAVAAGLLRPGEATSESFCFAHGVGRETLRDDLLVSRRIALRPSLESTHAAAPPAERALRTVGCFLLDGKHWDIKYEGVIVRLRDSAGLRCIAHLLLHQDDPLPARDLARVSRVVRIGLRGQGQDCTDEQAQLVVTQRVKGALELISAVHPVLGRHLKASIRTGTFCAYVPKPEQPISWLL